MCLGDLGAGVLTFCCFFFFFFGGGVWCVLVQFGFLGALFVLFFGLEFLNSLSLGLIFVVCLTIAMLNLKKNKSRQSCHPRHANQPDH